MPDTNHSSPALSSLVCDLAPWMLSVESNRLKQSPPGLCGSPVLQVTWKTLINNSRVLGKGAAGVTAGEGRARAKHRGQRGDRGCDHSPDTGFGMETLY